MGNGFLSQILTVVFWVQFLVLGWGIFLRKTSGSDNLVVDLCQSCQVNESIALIASWQPDGKCAKLNQKEEDHQQSAGLILGALWEHFRVREGVKWE